MTDDEPDSNRLFVGVPNVVCEELLLAVVGGLNDFDLVVTGNDRVDICAMIERDVSSSSKWECSLSLELVVYDANLKIYFENKYNLLQFGV